MNTRSRVGAGLAGLILLILGGTAGYVVIEGAPPFEAFWMVMLTITTVGYSLPFTLSTAGEAFTIVVMVLGVGSALLHCRGRHRAALPAAQ